MIAIDEAFVTRTLQTLVAIDSVNPDLDPAGAGEAAIADAIAGILRSLGLEVEPIEHRSGRTSVVGTLRGAGGGRSLMLNGHIDTVSTAGMTEPFSARIDGGRLYGRGSFDMKGSIAACIGAVEALVRGGRRPAGDIVVAAVADEEVASIGMQGVLERFRTDGAIVTEPTSLDICLAHKGFVWYVVTTHGRAAHGSRPDLGMDANARMGRVLVRLEALGARLAGGRAHARVGPASLHAATLHGGTGLSTYAAECRLGLERRTIPGETEPEATAQITAILDDLRSADPTFAAQLDVTLVRGAFEALPDSLLVRSLSQCAEASLGRAPQLVGMTAWMDAALSAAAGIDTVVFGPHGEGAHAAVEWVDLVSVHRVAEILARTALDYCGPDVWSPARRAPHPG